MKPKFLPVLISCLTAIILMTSTAPVSAQLVVDVDSGHADPLPIGVPRFSAAETEAEVATELAQVIAGNLERSGLFEVIGADSVATRENIPDLAEWRVVRGATALVTGWVDRESDGRLRVGFRLFDTFSEDQLIGLAYRGSEGIMRRIAHKISDQVFERLTGEMGYFDSRIVFIAESGPATLLEKRVAIMDQDGANVTVLSDGANQIITPRFSPTNENIVYMAFVNRSARVYLHNIRSGRREVLGDFPGMKFAPRFSPDGEQVIMSLAIDGNTDIFVLDLETRRISQLTTSSSTEVSPCFSPDGSHITFVSDRSGSPQLYVMNADGSNVRRLSRGQGSYTTPVWSPRGDVIAFTKQDRADKKFYIGVMEVADNGSGVEQIGNERLLATGDLVEGPTWSPNGRVLMFTRDTYEGSSTRRRLISIDFTGYNEREVATPGDASDPAWSSLL